MDELQDLRQSLRPLWTPFLALVVMLVVSGMAFSQAGQVNVPPAPDALFLEPVRIDAVRHTLEPAGQHGPLQRTTVAVRLARSDDWPGISFRFSGATAGISIIPPVTLDLYLTSSPAEQAERHRQWPNVFPQIQVHGVAEGGQVLVDPRVAHTSRVNEKRQSELLGYGLLALALVPGFILFRKARTVWNRLMI